MLERFKLLLQEMNRGIYEKNTEISLSLLAALAGESVILLGPPGVASREECLDPTVSIFIPFSPADSWKRSKAIRFLASAF